MDILQLEEKNSHNLAITVSFHLQRLLNILYETAVKELFPGSFPWEDVGSTIIHSHSGAWSPTPLPMAPEPGSTKTWKRTSQQWEEDEILATDELLKLILVPTTVRQEFGLTWLLVIESTLQGPLPGPI